MSHSIAKLRPCSNPDFVGELTRAHFASLAKTDAHVQVYYSSYMTLIGVHELHE